jgi:hypothetical protein
VPPAAEPRPHRGIDHAVDQIETQLRLKGATMSVGVRRSAPSLNAAPRNCAVAGVEIDHAARLIDRRRGLLGVGTVRIGGVGGLRSLGNSCAKSSAPVARPEQKSESSIPTVNTGSFSLSRRDTGCDKGEVRLATPHHGGDGQQFPQITARHFGRQSLLGRFQPLRWAS